MKVARGSWAFLLLTILVGTAGGVLRADVIETKEGAHLVGHITKIADGKVTIDTEFAGEVAVLQKHIVRIETDGPVAVRLANGQRYDGRLSGASGTEQVAAAAGPVPASVTDIAAIWAAGAPDPATLSHWKFETGVDVAGKTGNHNQLGSSYSATATLTGPKDTLILSSNYYRQSTDGVKSADQLKAGADFSDNYSDRSSWYARDEAGFDHIKDLSLYDTLATGIGYDFIKEVEQKMTGRIGLAYRYEDYSGTGAQNLHTMALDLGLNQSFKFDNSELTARAAIVANFEDIANMHITQETDYDVPVGKSSWKLRLGIANDYNSKPAEDLRKLDTTYFGRLILSWK